VASSSSQEREPRTALGSVMSWTRSSSARCESKKFMMVPAAIYHSRYAKESIFKGAMRSMDVAEATSNYRFFQNILEVVRFAHGCFASSSLESLSLGLMRLV